MDGVIGRNNKRPSPVPYDHLLLGGVGNISTKVEFITAGDEICSYLGLTESFSLSRAVCSESAISRALGLSTGLYV